MGYDTERFTSGLNEEFICAICQEVLEDPMECGTCQTSFCSACINLWLTKNKSCPNRCELNFDRCHKFLRSVLENLILTCSNKPEGCLELVKLGDLKRHESSECNYRKVSCSNQGCTVQYLLCEAEAHQSACEMRRVICNKCGQGYIYSDADSHNCIGFLAKTLCFLSENVRAVQIRLGEIDLKFPETRLHFSAKCSECEGYPIRGDRYICVACRSYSLCWRCKDKTTHVHKEWFRLSKESEHNCVTCDGCGVFPLPALRFKCKICPNFGKSYEDFCIECRNSKEHAHKEFFVWAPYQISVKELTPEKLAYHPGEKFQRMWNIFNIGNEPISDFYITCIAGDCCSKHYIANHPSYDFPGITIEPRSSKDIPVNDVITQQTPGYYKSEWVIASTDRMNSFGPTLFMEIFVLAKA